MNAVVSMQSTAVAQPATAQEIKAHVQRIQQVMKAVMKAGIHYGKIPGAGDKNTLFKPGAEVLCVTFRIAPTYRIDDLSDGDQVRYRVTCIGTHQATGVMLGEGMGEASSNEEKYKWRNSVCDEEFEEAAEDRKRVKWQRGRESAYKRYQVRTEPADIANTVLKMACKRAQVAMTINVTGASDIFAQDLEDLPPEMLGGDEGGGDETRASGGKPATARPQAKATAAAQTGKINAGQLAVLKKQMDDAGVADADVLKKFEIAAIEELPFAKLNDALLWLKSIHEGK